MNSHLGMFIFASWIFFLFIILRRPNKHVVIEESEFRKKWVNRNREQSKILQEWEDRKLEQNAQRAGHSAYTDWLKGHLIVVFPSTCSIYLLYHPESAKYKDDPKAFDRLAGEYFKKLKDEHIDILGRFESHYGRSEKNSQEHKAREGTN